MVEVTQATHIHPFPDDYIFNWSKSKYIHILVENHCSDCWGVWFDEMLDSLDVYAHLSMCRLKSHPSAYVARIYDEMRAERETPRIMFQFRYPQLKLRYQDQKEPVLDTADSYSFFSPCGKGCGIIARGATFCHIVKQFSSGSFSSYRMQRFMIDDRDSEYNKCRVKRIRKKMRRRLMHLCQAS